MLHVKNRRPGDLSGRTAPTLYFTWYNQGNSTLLKEFEELTELQTAKPRLQLALLMPAGMVLGCSIGLSIFGEYQVVSIVLTVLAIALLCLPWLLRAWAASTYRDAAYELTAQINAGEFGWEFMQEDDPLWEVLGDLFGQHGITMVNDLFSNENVDAAIAPDLAKLLRRTADERLTLRRRRSLGESVDTSYLRMHARAVVPEMVAIYRDIRPHN